MANTIYKVIKGTKGVKAQKDIYTHTESTSTQLSTWAYQASTR